MPPRPGRLADDWLRYIRPHLRAFEALGRGERRDYIAKLSRKVQLSDNTLRRFIAAAQFLEGEGIVVLPSGVRMPVAAVERVARIAAREPERRRELLDDVAAGKLTIVALREVLKKSRRRPAAKRHRAATPSDPLEERVMRELESRRICERHDMVLGHVNEEAFGWLFLSPTLRPARVIHLPQGRRVLILDERASQGTAASFMSQKKEFLRQILMTTSLYEFVYVYASSWRDDVEKLVKAVCPEVRERVVQMSELPRVQTKNRRRSLARHSV